MASAQTHAQAGSSSSTSNSTRTAGATDDGDEFVRTKILLVGMRRSGKTSIRQVLFDELPPKQSFFIEPTVTVTKHKYDTIIPLEIWDVPGDITPDKLSEPFSSFASIIFVIDILAKLPQPIDRLLLFFTEALQQNPGVFLEVFVHKAEALADDFRDETYKLVQARILDELADLSPITVSAAQSPTSASYFPHSHVDMISGAQTPAGTRQIDPETISPVFHLTSIHDNTIRAAFSDVLHRLLEATSLPHLEELIDVFTTASLVKKAFLFDTKARIFVARDQSPPDIANFGICCDYLEMVNAFGNLYKSPIISPSDHPRRNIHTAQSLTSPPTSIAPSTPSSPKSLASTPTHTASQSSTLLARPPLPGPSNSAPSGSSISPNAPSSSPPIFRSHSRRPSAGATGTSESAIGDIITNTASSSPSTSIQTLTQVLAQSQLHSGSGPGSGHGSSGPVGSVPPRSLPASKSQQGIPPVDPRKPVFHAFAATTLSDTTLLYLAVTPPPPPSPPASSNGNGNGVHSTSTSTGNATRGRANLALVAMLYNNIWQEKRGLIEYNAVFLREGIHEIYDVELDSRRRSVAHAPSGDANVRAQSISRR